jgi:hypothetical protein
MKQVVLFLSLFFSVTVQAQVIGGESVYQFLRLSNSAHTSGMGGMCVSSTSKDIALAFSNPALLRPSITNQFSVNNNFFLHTATVTNIAYGHYFAKQEISAAAGLTYVNHGKQTLTYSNGTIVNEQPAVEMAFKVMASKQYKNNWRYGAAVKFINSQLLAFQSAGIAADAGLQYVDTAKKFSFGMLAKNIGFQLSTYRGAGQEPLPFDMQIGISKKMLKAPFGFHATLHHLYQWNIAYNNPADQTSSILFGTIDSTFTTSFATKLFRHLNIGVAILLGKKTEINIGYNHLRRSELSLTEKPALAGFSGGVGVILPKFRLQYARSIYSIAGAYNEVGINFSMKELFGLGKVAPAYAY